MNSTYCRKVEVTILTPTYNREYTLPRLYNSLLNQSDMRFIWVIVDDGSTDNTKELVESFKTDNFPIMYLHKGNGGKHTAVNLGVKYIDTEYTFIVDSDDFLRENAIELVNKWIEEIDGIKGFAGISGVRVYNEEGQNVIGEFPDNCEYIDCLNSERKRNKLMGDKAEIYKTELLKQNPFPEYKNEKFIPESVVWNKFALMGLKVRWHKEGIVVCEYLKDGLTSAVNQRDYFEKNYKGYRLDCEVSLKALKFPYNYSAASVFYAKSRAIGKAKKCLDGINITLFEKMLIKVLGMIRYQWGRY